MKLTDKYAVGKKFTMKNGSELEIISIEKDTNYRVVRFESGYEARTSVSSIRRGFVRDYLKPNVCGVGVYDLGRQDKKHVLYGRWRGMIYRCYSESCSEYKYYGEKGAYVSNDWLIFSNYVRDIEAKENYERLISEPSKWHIDKDILSPNEKCYSNETALIVNRAENNRERNKRNGYPSDCQRKPIIQLTIDNEFICEYESLSEAYRKTGISSGNICSCCKGILKTAGGYVWKYK
ncbi:NUMOD1 domain-containing DNA-binding protein [Romboutsia sp.]|uniref:NUMOD1 domain-containing DNA-binding protein n=1 Tax=Romboutsia sp. TaxID=1965302 RepID=UPI002CFF40EE|nr:NUMOD1 domain-containing DNA-binding protein [Romboutsia sp.]HSQ88719.1 NUMOD1 domain-containing DNA-binding protein [Romboutsia sp.]